VLTTSVTNAKNCQLEVTDYVIELESNK